MKWFALLSTIGIASAAAAILGIDYGAEFVKSSLVAPNAPFEIVLTPDSQRKDASGLVIKPDDGERLYGSSGLGLLSKFPSNALYAIKPLLGVPFDDLRVGLFEETHPGVQLVRTPRNTVAFNVSGDVVPVEEIVAMQINDVKERATEMLREKTHSRTAVLRDIAISVPGHFGSAQRQALVDSIGLVNADLVGLVSDHIAVAVNYANSPAMSSKLSNEKHYVVVYDSGASSTTSTLVGLKLREGDDSIVDVEVEGFGSSIELSGRSLTSLLREMLVQRFFESHKPVDRTPRLLNRLWREAERVKHVLSANTDVSVHVESLADDADLNTKITREEFEKAAADIVSEVVRPLRDSLSNFSGNELDAVVLVGGATRTPFILDQLKSEVGESKLSKNVNADEANVQGTCMRGVNLSGVYRSKRKFEISDVTTHNYEVHVRSKSGGPPNVTEVFSAGTLFGAESELYLPNDVSQIEVYEDKKKLVSWDLPNVRKNIDALYEPGPFTCVDKAKLRAKFVVDLNGVFRLSSVDAVCSSIKSPSSSSTTNSITSSAVSASGKSEETTKSDPSSSSSAASETVTTPATDSSSESLTEPVTESSTASASSSSSASARPKTRRLSTQVSWVQAPIGMSEKSNIRAHLNALDKNDETRKSYSILHHELESLTYRIRGLVSEGQQELSELGNRLLSWIEEGTGSLDELKSHLTEARGVFKRGEESTTETAATSTTTTSSTTTTTVGDTSTVNNTSSSTEEPETTTTKPAHDEL